jgi:putative tryptophan/tyrosine transport system substrate-binding protein
VGSAAFLNIRRVQLVQLATFHRLPATFSFREAAEAGALMSYGPSIGDAYRQWAVYAARIRSSLPASENLHKSRHSDRCLGHAAWRQVL